MKDDTYQITEKAAELFQLLPEPEQRKVIDYLKDLVSEASTTSSVPALASESTP